VQNLYMFVFTSYCLCVQSLRCVEPLLLNTWSPRLLSQKPVQNEATLGATKAGYYKHNGCYLKFSS